MEVHHHPELEKKGLKEYVLEGLMIFLAVMMGFVAENIRENISEHKRAAELPVRILMILKRIQRRCTRLCALAGISWQL
jgi:hypothetical protein